MADRRKAPKRVASPRARRAGRRPLRLWLALAVGIGFFAYLIPLCQTVLASPGTHPVERARATPLTRYLQADHDLTTGRASLPLAVLAGAPEPARLLHPLLQPGRLGDRDAPGQRSSPHARPDLSRSPPGR